MTKTRLEVFGRHGPDGWQNPETGEEFFNDRVFTPHGLLGKLLVDFEEPCGDGCNCQDPDYNEGMDHAEAVIVQADEVVLIRRGFPDSWTAPTTGASVELNPFGFYVFEVQARNGMVRYRLLDDELEWNTDMKDGDALAHHQLGLRTYSVWSPEREAPPRTRRTVETKVIRDLS